MMLADILEMIYSLPKEDQLKNMSATERKELIHKFDDKSESDSEEE